jgi:hypothetical protein
MNQGDSQMGRKLRAAVTAGALVIAAFSAGTALAQKYGGILRTYDPDSPGGLSIQEEATVFARGPMGGVFKVRPERSAEQPRLRLDK